MKKRDKDLTEEEASALDEYYTENLPTLGANEGGIFDRRVGHLLVIDEVTATYIKSETDNSSKTPTQIISDLIKEKLSIA